MTTISGFIERNFLHFNARETVAAAEAWKQHRAEGGRMLLALAGAMSTAEIGISLAKVIRAGYVDAISTTAANFEEDIFNLVAHNDYRLVPNYRDLSPDDELQLRDDGYNRVADTCIPEDTMRGIQKLLLKYWQEAAAKDDSHFPVEYFYRLIDEGHLDKLTQIPREHSWVIAAREKRIPVYTPGWEDSTLGNMFTANVIKGNLKSHRVLRSGTEQMEHLVRWYLEQSSQSKIGFFQIGGGIAGDFAICAVPLIIQDLELRETNLWSYFAQISDSTTSYGSYSGAAPNEKITWYKLDRDAPKFMINSDATIVAPLVFAYLLGE